MVRRSFDSKTLLKQAKAFTFEVFKVGIPLDITLEDLTDTPYAGYHFLTYHQGDSKPGDYFFEDHQKPKGTATISLIIECDEGEVISPKQTRNLILNALDPSVTLQMIGQHTHIFSNHQDRHTAMPAIALEETKELLRETVSKAVARGEHVQKLEKDSEELLAAAQQFELSAGRLNDQGCWPFSLIFRSMSNSCTLL